MKTILLLSDTHGYMDERIISYAKQADEVWHAGDIGHLSVTDALEKTSTLRAVYGNIDNHKIRASYPENNIFMLEGIRFMLTHIGGAAGNYNPRVRKLLEMHKPGVFICGHSHILKVIYLKDSALMHLNPGAAGKQGFHKVRTMLRFQVEKGQLKNMEVIELGLRGAS